MTFNNRQDVPRRWAASLPWLVVAAVLAVMLGVDPIPQDPGYHRFADQRVAFGIPNAWNVLSNLAFVLVGAAGLGYAAWLRRARQAGVPPAYFVTFAGVLLTGFGSAWYHLAPDNESLFWDRLLMSVGFMGFFCTVVAELAGRRLADRLLLPLLLAGAGSVLYWLVTERLGAGDLRPYALVQFLPGLLLPAMLVLWPRPRPYARYILVLIGFYALSKGAELLDAQLFGLGGVVGGHALKHVLAALGIAWLLPVLHVRYHRRSASAAKVS
jgi:hypothetical protein